MAELGDGLLRKMRDGVRTTEQNVKRGRVSGCRLQFGEEVNGLGEQVSSLVACGSATSSTTFAVQANCWEWETTSWSQLQAAVPTRSATPVTVASVVDDLNRAQLLIIGWLVAPVSNAAEPLYVWAWDGLKWTLLD